MKNYPNQASTFVRVRDTLVITKELRDRGETVLDDGVLGYELARRHAYTFRGFDYVNGTPAALEARILQEQTKSSGNQGARTNARELRRTLIDLGWLLDDGSMAPSGDDLLASAPGGDEERALLRAALLDLEVGDTEGINYSHPVVIMLQLLAHAPSHHRAGLELMLEALDDSEAETARVMRLYDEIREMTSNERAARLGIGETVRANSVKVFPTLAKYAGLVTEDLGHTWRPTVEGLAAIGLGTGRDEMAEAAPQVDVTPPVNPPLTNGVKRRRRLTRGREKRADEVGQHAVNKTVPRGLTPDQQAGAQQRLQERTIAHQELVRRFASIVDGGRFHEDPSSYDLAWVSDESVDVHLFEMKTIADDADAQVTRAIGQLMYYAHFNIVARFACYPSTRTLIVNGDVHEDLLDFLESLAIGVLRVSENANVSALNQSGQLMLELLPLKPVGA